MTEWQLRHDVILLSLMWHGMELVCRQVWERFLTSSGVEGKRFACRMPR